MTDCKNCMYGKMTYFHDRDRQTGEMKSTPYKVICKKPSYGKRRYDVKIKADCREYEKRQRPASTEE